MIEFAAANPDLDEYARTAAEHGWECYEGISGKWVSFRRTDPEGRVAVTVHFWDDGTVREAMLMRYAGPPFTPGIMSWLSA